jgi:phage tail protein X
MDEYLTHATVTGDRWDLLAQRYYGDGTAYGFLLQANPDVAFTPLLPAGITLRIPILDAATLNPAPASPSDSQEFPWL